MALAAKKTRTLRGASYMRASTDEQAESIPGQEEAIRADLPDLGIGIADSLWFADEGISGIDTADERPGYQAMLEAATKGKFTHLVVWDLSRLTRSESVDAIAELRPLKKAGITIVTLDMGPIDWRDIGTLIKAIVELDSNNKFVRKLLRSTMRGLIRLAKEGKWPCGRTPRGYTTDDQSKLTPNDESHIPPAVFEAYRDGASLSQLKDLVQERFGIRTSPTGIRWMLRNRNYTGTLTWNAISRGRRIGYRGGKIKWGKDDESQPLVKGRTAEADQIIVPNAHPALVSQKLFDEVQKLLEANRKSTSPIPPEKNDFILTNLLRCSKCGYRLVGGRSHRTGNKLYLCKSQQQGAQRGNCPKYSVREDAILDSILEVLQTTYGSPHYRQRVLESLRTELTTNRKKVDTKALGKELDAAQKSFDVAMANYLANTVDECREELASEMGLKKADLESLKRAYAQATTSVDTSLEQAEVIVDASIAAFDELQEAFSEGTPAMLRSLLRANIDHITISVKEGRTKTGTRRTFTYQGGDLFFRKDSYLFSSLGRTQQVALKRKAG